MKHVFDSKYLSPEIKNNFKKHSLILLFFIFLKETVFKEVF